jgi:hypothetical protein
MSASIPTLIYRQFYLSPFMCSGSIQEETIVELTVFGLVFSLPRDNRNLIVFNEGAHELWAHFGSNFSPRTSLYKFPFEIIVPETCTYSHVKLKAVWSKIWRDRIFCRRFFRTLKSRF